MRVADFDFELPEELIAQAPPEVRGGSRMLVVPRGGGVLVDDIFAGLPGYLRAGDLLVLNDSRVLPGRLYATRKGLRTQRGTGAPSGRVEVLLTGGEGRDWTALVKPGRKVPVGETLVFGEGELTAEVVGSGEFGERTLRFAEDADFYAKVERLGHMPLPPYIHRADVAEDKARYQTVYAGAVGSAAAPTAGLHFTVEMLDRLRGMGVEIAYVTLHVGLGTFQPLRVSEVSEIVLHAERYTLPGATAAAVVRAKAEGRRVIAVGTTAVRTLESCAGRMVEHSGETSIFISPGYGFRVVTGLLTNFHLPQSSLLMLVSAFEGSRERVLGAYGHAVGAGYRFFSYGDCMLIL